MEKMKLVEAIARKLELEPRRAELAVDAVIAELVSPWIVARPGEEVALLDNSCTNNCKQPMAAEFEAPIQRS